MVSQKCPKCDYLQQETDECARCGLIFARYRTRNEPLEAVEKPPLRRRIWLWLRIGSLATGLVAVALILQQARPPVVPEAADAEAFHKKISRAARDVRRGRPASLQISPAEANLWLEENLLPETPDESVSRGVERILDAQAELAEVQGSVRDLKVDFVESEVVVWMLFDFHGRELSLSMRGELSEEEGFLRLRLTGGQLGILPIPRAALQRAVARVFENPEHRDTFRLPEHVAQLEVREGRLQIEYR